MRLTKIISTPLALIMLAALVACSSGSSHTTPPPPPVISVSVSGAPASLATNATASITATVTNDSANAGVTWSCAPSGSCGTFSAATTPSGTAVTYTAPATVPSSPVTVTAASVTDSTKTGSATITISQALADGNYVFSLLGSDVSGGPAVYSVSGVFTVASGAITGGEQDFVDFNNSDLHDMINPTGSAVTTAPSGNLQITLNTCLGTDCTQTDAVVGNGTGTETINGAMISASKGHIIEFDASATGSGTLELQDPTAAATAPAGGYAFAAQGANGPQIAVGGILNVSGAALSTTGTVFDLNQGGTIYSGQTITTSAVSAPDASGRFQISMTPTNTPTIPIFNFAAYIVDANHIQIVEANIPLSGVAYAQNAGNLGLASTAFAVGMTGAHTFLPFQVAAILTADATTNVGGTITYNDILNQQVSAAPITGGVYLADASNPGRYTLTGVTDGNFTFNIELYLDGNGHALAVTLDTAQDVLEGVGYQGSSTINVAGNYVMSATGYDVTNALELDAVGAVTVASSATTFASSTSGVDLNWLSSTTAAAQSEVTVSGAFTPGSNGVSTGAGNTITGLDVTAAANVDAFDYYAADSSHVIAIETDSNQQTIILFEQ